MVAPVSSNPTGGNFFNKFTFPEFIFQTDLLSDFLSELFIVKNPNVDIWCDADARWEKTLNLATGVKIFSFRSIDRSPKLYCQPDGEIRP